MKKRVFRERYNEVEPIKVIKVEETKEEPKKTTTKKKVGK